MRRWSISSKTAASVFVVEKTASSVTMKNKWGYLGLFLTIILGIAPTAYAMSLNGEYIINATTTDLGANSWQFIYHITNVNQGFVPQSGLDGFIIQVPLTATISNIIVPSGYTGGIWGWNTYTSPPNSDVFYALEESLSPLLPGYQRLRFWGRGIESVYPQLTTTEFSFQASNVMVGAIPGETVTFWGPGNQPAPESYEVCHGARKIGQTGAR
jgi:hypothetical protein